MRRRNFFSKSAAAGLGIVAASPMIESFTKQNVGTSVLDEYRPVQPEIMAPRGAVYIPAKAYNTWQQWKNYSHDETERDFGYATSIGLNSLRIWLSYEYWLEDPQRHEECLEHMLSAADKKGLKILLALFDSCGVENTKAAREDRNPKTAVAVTSPSNAISRDPNRWNEPAKFVNRMVERLANDKRLLAIEIMNEPGFRNNRIAMSRFLFKVANKKKGSVPLSIGSLHDMQNWGNFMDLGLDVLQVHLNFPTKLGEFKHELNLARQVGETLGRPLWVTEWQRIRISGSGWDEKKIPQAELGPDLASLAETVSSAGIGNYFWSLMLKPAYLKPQRNIGTFNGLFFEDGTVYSLADARAVSQNPNFQAVERKELPDYFIKPQ